MRRSAVEWQPSTRHRRPADTPSTVSRWYLGNPNAIRATARGVSSHPYRTPAEPGQSVGDGAHEGIDLEEIVLHTIIAVAGAVGVLTGSNRTESPNALIGALVVFFAAENFLSQIRRRRRTRARTRPLLMSRRWTGWPRSAQRRPRAATHEDREHEQQDHQKRQVVAKRLAARERDRDT